MSDRSRNRGGAPARPTSARRTTSSTAMRAVFLLVVVALVLGLMMSATQVRAQGATTAPSTTPGPSAGAPAETPAGRPPEVIFDSPSATGSLTTPIVFTTTFQAPEEPIRVELLTRLAGGTSDLVREAAVSREPSGAWTATVSQVGFTPPNTRYEYRFRAVTPDGPVTGPTGELRIVDDRFDWRTLEGDGITLHWYAGDDAFAARALRIGEDAIRNAAELLGVQEVAPVDFLVYDSPEALYGAMGPGTREHVGGQANSATRTLIGTIRTSDVASDWVDTLVTHELTHIVFSDATDNPYHQPPRWLNEGLAVYLSEGYGVGDRAQVAGAAANGTLIPLSGIAGLFPTTYERFSLAYAESVSAVDFFIDRYGRDTLVRLITSYHDGVTDDEAFLAATGQDADAFDDAWLEAQGAQRPRPYGPQPAPPGPIPSDWVTGDPAVAP
ncbi:MAG: hypothetical protein KF809_03755 [Chloroflexi bacterium]|nr:hypothetical protein [Chloroflexota bacterium]